MTRAPAVIDIRPPDLPEAHVTITLADRIPGALAARLSDAQAAPFGRLSRNEREAIAAFYALGNYEPVWIKGRAWSAAARALIAALKNAGEDGLDPADYPIAAIGVVSRGDSAAELAEAELKLSAAAVAYARDARGGRLDPSRLSNLITPKLELPAADAVLTQLAAAPDAGAALASYNPPHAGYRALKKKLAAVRARRPSRPPVAGVPQGPALGVLTRATVAALGHRPPARLEADLIANMERWRWLPHDLGARYVHVNVPEFRLRIVEGGSTLHETRVVVGKPETPTPLFSATMDHVIVNPSWYVPPSILKNEFLPRLAWDPFYARRQGYEVIRRGREIMIRQPPGERNALGFIKFMFPNQHAVYLHDTPSRHLFRRERRAFSHGCIRVDQPFRLAEVLLGHQGWHEDKVRGLVGRGERTIKLTSRLPVHLTYFTLAVTPEGEVRTFEDLYGINRRLRTALGLEPEARATAGAISPWLRSHDEGVDGRLTSR